MAVDSNGAFDLSHEVTGKGFSTIRTGTAQGRLTAVSTLTLPGEDATPSFVPQRQVTVSAAVATDGSTNYTFTGTGSVTAPSGQASVSSSPYSLPDPVPFNQTLHQLNVTGSPNSSVRFFVGTIENRPELMRVCFRIELTGVLRVACTRHQIATGALVGGDTIDDLGGTLYYHDAETGDAFEPSLLRCVQQYVTLGVDVDTRYRFGVAAYDSRKSDGGLLPPPAEFYTGSVTVPSNGLLEYRLEYAQTPVYAVTRATVTNNRVASISRNAGGPHAGVTEQCN